MTKFVPETIKLRMQRWPASDYFIIRSSYENTAFPILDNELTNMSSLRFYCSCHFYFLTSLPSILFLSSWLYVFKYRAHHSIVG